MKEKTKPGEEMIQASVYAGVYHVLLAGMVASTTLFVFGLVRGIMLHTFFPLTADWIRQHYHWHAVTAGLAALDPTTLMMLATVLLILTPVARVVVSIYVFAADGDRKYALVTSTVFAIMVLTFVLSRFGLQ
jgi:uncharacterized membrane protein